MGFGDKILALGKIFSYLMFIYDQRRKAYLLDLDFTCYTDSSIIIIPTPLYR